MCTCSHIWLKMRKIVILPQSAFSKSPKEQMLCAFGENNPHRAFYLSRHRCMMLKNFLSFLKPKAGFSSCKKQIGLSFIDVFLKCQERERSRIEWQWHQYYIEVVTLSVGHTRNSVPLAIRNPPHVTASHHRGLKFQSRQCNLGKSYSTICNLNNFCFKQSHPEHVMGAMEVILF